jgi:enoyl-CoA hydratase/carnithine racemase
MTSEPDNQMELRTIRQETVRRVATVTLDRPHRHNAWTGRMHAEFRWVMDRIEQDPAVRAVVITGTPPAFCVGGDSEALARHAERGGYDTGLPPHPATPGIHRRPEYDDDFAWMFGYRTPIIAAVNGAAAGVGLALALFCDLRFGAATAKLTTAAPKLGLPAEYGMSWILPRLIGVTRSNDLLLSGRVVTARDTADWGLWNDVLPDGEAALAVATDYAELLATSVGPNAVTVTKSQIYRDLHRHDAAASVAESKTLLDEAMGAAEYREGIAALREKRPPSF